MTTRTHGILDYLVGILLIFAPNIFGFADGGWAQRLPVILGVTTLIYSLLTRYELGVIKVIPFRAHLILDTLSGVLLLISPWLFGFADRVWGPHVGVGIVELAAVMMTRSSARASLDAGPGTTART